MTGTAGRWRCTRLAPEHKWPAAIDDCEAAALWVVEHVKAEFGTDRILIGGESSGAYLAVSTMVRMRDRHNFANWRGAILINGSYDLRPTFSKTAGNTDPLLDEEAIGFFHDHFVGDTPAADNLDSPEVSPVIADVSGLGPAQFTIGTRDSLLDENLTMAARWQSSGNETDLEVYPGATHAFSNFPIAIADEAIEKIHNWANRQISPSM